MKTDRLIKVSYYLHPAEKKLLENYCNENNVRASHIVRNLVKEMLKLPFVTQVRIDVDFTNYINELIRQANNLNQVARKVNSGLELSILDEHELYDSINFINEQINELRKKLR